ncbi:hypothetical protein MSUIS_05390 [Mycoplasma suis KI3806]|uniref:Uncharacterized protein n=1 Tax=Mycoplasma suis (strain KI_3806) TaxID=708248 RepID=F0V1V1_MYCS3|nr:hypothetical protein [Mycoplasma suis]CBZ40632.1 hypothetical protein MSUIS_05390 [Mycoplasma suis KI3806]
MSEKPVSSTSSSLVSRNGNTSHSAQSHSGTDSQGSSQESDTHSTEEALKVEKTKDNKQEIIFSYYNGDIQKTTCEKVSENKFSCDNITLRKGSLIR